MNDNGYFSSDRSGLLSLHSSVICLLNTLMTDTMGWILERLREQFPRVNSIDSPVEGTNLGVPQGLCLGSLLFLIYINDLSRA